MILYDWTDYDGRKLIERFPKFPGEVETSRNWWNNQLDRITKDVVWEYPTIRPELPQENCPRLFVSHRRCDKECARRVAWLADQQGFDIWLDLLDPRLDIPGTPPKVIALIIEFALLNCTHVSVVMTPKTNGSQWVPYEYGRVKDKVTLTEEALCCLSDQLPLTEIPEYMHLGEIVNNEDELKGWLKREFDKWTKKKCMSSSQPAGGWPFGEPKALWDDCHAIDNSSDRGSLTSVRRQLSWPD